MCTIIIILIFIIVLFHCSTDIHSALEYNICFQLLSIMSENKQTKMPFRPDLRKILICPNMFCTFLARKMKTQFLCTLCLHQCFNLKRTCLPVYQSLPCLPINEILKLMFALKTTYHFLPDNTKADLLVLKWIMFG